MSSFGNVLAEVGEFGPFQKRLLVALCLPSIFAAFNTIGQVFTGQSFPHRCNTGWILERGNLTEERRRNLTLPLGEDGGYERCRMFTPVDWDLETIEARGINSTSECLHGWDYDKPDGVSSIVTEVMTKKTTRQTTNKNFCSGLNPFCVSAISQFASSLSIRWTWFVATVA